MSRFPSVRQACRACLSLSSSFSLPTYRVSPISRPLSLYPGLAVYVSLPLSLSGRLFVFTELIFLSLYLNLASVLPFPCRASPFLPLSLDPHERAPATTQNQSVCCIVTVNCYPVYITAQWVLTNSATYPEVREARLRAVRLLPSKLEHIFGSMPQSHKLSSHRGILSLFVAREEYIL